MNKLLVIISSLFIFVSSSGQNCNCKENFNELVRSIEINHPGFKDKVTSKNVAYYINEKNNILKKAITKNYFVCYLLLDKYLKLFDDPHLNIFINYDTSNKKILRETFGYLDRIPINEKKILSYLSNNKIDSIEGIWEYKTKREYFKVAIIKNKKYNFWDAIVLKADSLVWYPGQKKFRIFHKDKFNLGIEYYAKDHTKSIKEVEITKSKLVIDNKVEWKKASPIQLNDTIENDNIVYYKKINSEIGYLKITSFDLKYKTAIDSVLKVNKENFDTVKKLIIDIRNNGGGYAACYEPLLKYIYTNPVYRNSHYEILASADNIALYKQDNNSEGATSDEDKNFMNNLIKKMEANVNAYVSWLENDTIPYIDSNLTNPQKVAILINRNTYSAAENFLLFAKNSKKSLLYGEATRGTIDYVDIVSKRTLPSDFYYYYCPTSKKSTLNETSIFNQGFTPDKFIPMSNKDWVAFVINDLNLMK